MATTYLGFAIADSMFGNGMTVTRKVVDVIVVREMIEDGVIPALNPTHEATINAMRTRYGLNVEIPEKAPMIKLAGGDKFIVMSVRGLPRREGGKGEYTQEEIDGGTFEFSVWEVLQEPQSPSYGFATCSACGNTDVVSWGNCVYCGTPFDFDEDVQAAIS